MQLLTLKEGAFLVAKVKLIGDATPGSLRITVIMQHYKSPYILIDFLIRTRATLLQLYLSALTDEDWVSLFSDLNMLMKFIFKLMEFSISGPIILKSIIENMTQSCKLPI